MNCYLCGNEMKETTGSINAGWGKYDLTIDGVRLYVCEKCGERVLNPDELQMIQEISRAFHDSPEARPDILNVEEVAEYLRVTPQTVYNLIKSGKVPAVKIGREWRFSRHSIDSLLAEDGRISIAARSAPNQVIPDNDRRIIERHLKGMKASPQRGNP